MAANSSQRDPYYAVQEDVKQSLKGAEALFGRWQELLSSSNTASSDEYDWTTNELKKTLQNIEDAIDVAEEAPGKYRLDAAELSLRKKFIEDTRKNVHAMRESMTDVRTRAKLEQDQRNLLIKSAPSASVKDDPYSKAKESAIKSNTDFINENQQRTQVVIEKQDQELEELGVVVGNLGQIGRDINRELDDQAELLDNMDRDMDRTSGRMKNAMKKMNILIAKSKEKGSMITIILLVLALTVLAILIMQQ